MLRRRVTTIARAALAFVTETETEPEIHAMLVSGTTSLSLTASLQFNPPPRKPSAPLVLLFASRCYMYVASVRHMGPAC
jgi:hypothetical protein